MNETIIKKLLDSHEKVKQNREELKRRGYTKKDILIIKFLQHPTMKRAILMHCRECQGYSSKEARACTNTSCPLLVFRLKSPNAKTIKKAMDGYRKFMIDAGELNPELDTNVNFKDLFGEEDNDNDDNFIEDEEESESKE